LSAQTQIGPRAGEEAQCDEEGSTDDGAEQGRRDAREGGGHVVTGEDETAGEEAHGGSAEEGGEHPVQGMGRAGEGEMQVGMPGSDGGGDTVGEPCGGEAFDQGSRPGRGGTDAFDGEDSGGPGRAKHGAEPGRHAGRNQAGCGFRAQPQQTPGTGGDAPAELEGGAFASGGTATEMGEEGGDEDEGGETERGLGGGMAGFLDEKTGPTCAVGPPTLIKDGPDESEGREQEDQSGVLPMPCGDGPERCQKEGAGESGADGGGDPCQAQADGRWRRHSGGHAESMPLGGDQVESEVVGGEGGGGWIPGMIGNSVQTTDRVWDIFWDMTTDMRQSVPSGIH